MDVDTHALLGRLNLGMRLRVLTGTSSTKAKVKQSRYDVRLQKLLTYLPKIAVGRDKSFLSLLYNV